MDHLETNTAIGKEEEEEANHAIKKEEKSRTAKKKKKDQQPKPRNLIFVMISHGGNQAKECKAQLVDEAKQHGCHIVMINESTPDFSLVTPRGMDNPLARHKEVGLVDFRSVLVAEEEAKQFDLLDAK